MRTGIAPRAALAAAALAAAALPTAPAGATTPPRRAPAIWGGNPFVVEIEPYLFVPFGQWTRHPYEETVPGLSLRQFGPGPGIAVAAGLGGRTCLVRVRASAGTLGTGAWERYARAHGTSIDAHAEMFGGGVLVGCSVESVVGLPVEIAAGPALFFPRGGEENRTLGREYDYAMLNEALVATAEARALWRVAGVTVLTLSVAGMGGGDVVQYPGRPGRPLLGLLLAAGIRLDWRERR